MAQITLYVDDTLAERMKSAAESRGVSVSRWVAELVRRETDDAWPPEILALAGGFPEFPTAEDIRAGGGTDVPRDWP